MESNITAVTCHDRVVGSLRAFYDDLWATGRTALLNGTCEVAPFLDDLSQDQRLGLTLIVRPSVELSLRLLGVVERLRAIAPHQFYYEQSRFHFTVLSLITASESFGLAQTQVHIYRQVIREVLDHISPFEVTFIGISATPNSLLAQGFPTDDTLEHIRDSLRTRLRAVGLGESLDKRYRIRGSHVTLGRFLAPSETAPLVSLIERLREEKLGAMLVRQAQLVVNDFYMSADKAVTFEEVPFKEIKQ